MKHLFRRRKMSYRELGARGERRAVWFYRLRGYRVLARNLKLPAGEIDLVVRRGGMVALVEVKSRQSLTAGEGHDAVDRRKRAKLIQLGDQYATLHPGVHLRYDILSLFWTGRRFIVSHYPDAFRPESDPIRPWRWRR